MNIGTQCLGVVKNAKFLSNLMLIDQVSLTLGYFYVDTWYLLAVRFHPNLRVSWMCWQERAARCLEHANIRIDVSSRGYHLRNVRGR
jgi:hypothetical protein